MFFEVNESVRLVFSYFSMRELSPNRFSRSEQGRNTLSFGEGWGEANLA